MKKLITTMFICVLTMLSFVACVDDNTAKITKIEVSKMPTKIEYFVGEKFSAIGGRLTITKSDNTELVVDLLDEMCSVSTDIAGEKVAVNVTYKGWATTFDIKVVESELMLAKKSANLTISGYDIADNYITADYNLLKAEIATQIALINQCVDVDGVENALIVAETALKAIKTNTIESIADFTAMLAKATSSDTIKIKAGTYDLAQQIVIDKGVKVVGLGVVILQPASSFIGASDHEKNLLNVNNASDVILENIIVQNSLRSGIQIYNSTSVTLRGVTSKNNTLGGLIVNGSIVTACALKTSGNGVLGVNVDIAPNNPSKVARFSIDSASVIGEKIQISVDDSAKNITVTAPKTFTALKCGLSTVWTTATDIPVSEISQIALAIGEGVIFETVSTASDTEIANAIWTACGNKRKDIAVYNKTNDHYIAFEVWDGMSSGKAYEQLVSEGKTNVWVMHEYAPGGVKTAVLTNVRAKVSVGYSKSELEEVSFPLTSIGIATDNYENATFKIDMTKAFVYFKVDATDASDVNISWQNSNGYFSISGNADKKVVKIATKEFLGVYGDYDSAVITVNSNDGSPDGIRNSFYEFVPCADDTSPYVEKLKLGTYKDANGNAIIVRAGVERIETNLVGENYSGTGENWSSLDLTKYAFSQNGTLESAIKKFGYGVNAYFVVDYVSDTLTATADYRVRTNGNSVTKVITKGTVFTLNKSAE